MANIAPLFSTAPRIKLKVNGKDLAYAIGMNLNISVDVQPVTILGKFGPVSLEPTLYNVVTGTMQIIRLRSASAEDAAAADALLENTGQPTLVTTFDTDGKPIVTPIDSAQGVALSSNSPLNPDGGNLVRHLDPATVLLSKTFDMNMYMRIPLNNDELTEVPWLKIQDCRLTSRNVNISMGQLVNEPVSFQGIFATPFALGNGQNGGSPLFQIDEITK